MSEEEAKLFLEQVRQVARQEAQGTLSKCVQVIPATVVSGGSGTAVVRLATATDSSKDFSVPVATPQVISAGDKVNIAYWSNLSTGIILSK